MGSAGRTFGRYVLIDRLAAGRTSEVWLARMRGPARFKKLAVIKRMSLERDPKAGRTFVEEGTLAARLSHPHIAQVFEMGEEEGWRYMAMEYVAGQTLRAVLARGGKTLTTAHIAEIFSQLCSALAAAHDAGVVHRDVHPWNILVSYGGDVKLIDFGSARSDASDRTEIESVARRVPYMSPEQCKGDPVDARSDIFAVGACLYEALSGKNPFNRVNPVEAMDAVCRKKVGPVSRYDATFAPFDAIIAKALHKDPRRRYRNCREIVHALKELKHTERSLGAVMRRGFGTEVLTEKRVAEWEDSEISMPYEPPPRRRSSQKTAPRPSGPLSGIFGRRTSRDAQVLALGAGFLVTVLATASVTSALMSDSTPPPREERVVAPPVSEVTVPPKAEPAPEPVAVAVAEPVAAPVPAVEPALRAPPHTPTRVVVPAPAPPKPVVTPASASSRPRPKRITKDPVHSWMNEPTPSAVNDE